MRHVHCGQFSDSAAGCGGSQRAAASCGKGAPSWALMRHSAELRRGCVTFTVPPRISRQLGADFMFLLAELNSLAGPNVNFTRVRLLGTSQASYFAASQLMVNALRGSTRRLRHRVRCMPSCRCSWRNTFVESIITMLLSPRTPRSDSYAW